MAIYLKIAPDEVLQHDYGIDIQGEVFENPKMTRPHDLTPYERVEMKLTRTGIAGDFSFLNSTAMKGTGSGNEHRITWRVESGDLIYNGIFELFATFKADGVSRTTVPARLLIRRNPNRGEEVSA